MEKEKKESIKDMKNRLILKNAVFGVYFLGGIIMLLLKLTDIGYISALKDRALVQYDSLACVFTVLGITGALRTLRLIKNEALLRKYITRIDDERTVLLSQKAMTISVNIAFFAALILDIYFLPINIAISNAIIYFACFILIVYLAVLFILNRIM